ncbi:hypothetical protein AMIS_56080 [Actinoplanes missouriensis 431]|uniref:Uncharacterized protein n=1 Tax=Actinoplanes missouriensis (strain ATCC 14538 / DSM 43046 / CBS 188.64 / JCM 3121 / NBRC 102363 / NCIMB 12654 / NRRL B-3342 / UNCC 431) TaxID=512565 RepID=I0HCU1_ACTM4|nr:hypothetical protein [Actinoplanes missouriensis]BAL90828.1 hypothetical protein AMIS_56080 [Actinoplanes missouriensis 431]
MLTAGRTSMWKSQYQLALDGAPVAEWDPKVWKTGGRFALHGQEFEVRAHGWGSTFSMTDAHGTVLAEAKRVGRKNWTVQAGDAAYEFRRTSIWRNDQELLHNGVAVGTIRRTSSWSGDLEADLPGLPLPVQIFIVGVMITWWNSQAAAAA